MEVLRKGLFHSKRYQEDYEYRVIIEMVRVSLLYVHGKAEEMLPLATELIDKGNR